MRDGTLFIKTFDLLADVRCPDFGCAAEMFTSDRILELDTLGPLTALAPGAATTHTER